MSTGTPGKSRVSSFSHVRIMAKYNFLNYFRARRFYVLLAIVLIISSLLTVAIGYYRPATFLTDELGFYRSTWGGFVNLVVILSTAFFGGDAISGEFQNRTGYFLLPNPIRRSTVYAGKWIAALAASTLVLAVFALIMLANGLYYFPGSIPSQFTQSVLFAWVYLVAGLSLVFALSSLFKSSSISVLMSVILLLFVFNVVDTISSSIVHQEPWFSVTYGGAIAQNVLNETYPAHMTTTSFPGPGGRGGFSLTSYNATIPEGLMILAVYFIAMAIVGLWLFEKKEFTS